MAKKDIIIHQFKKGIAPNPNGRPKGSISKKPKLKKLLKDLSAIMTTLTDREKHLAYQLYEIVDSDLKFNNVSASINHLYFIESDFGIKIGISKNVTKRIEQYGVMNITNQHLYGCGGSRLYPTYFFTPTNGISPEEYAQHRMLPIGHQVNWHFIYKAKRFGQADPVMLQKMKAALHSGSRLVVSALLPRVDLGNSGATGTYHYTDDTWVLTHEIAQDLLHSKKIAGHAMVITGYDDLAVVKDHAGHRHQGLFTLRNSWSAWVGDWGNFYMSYDYAELLLLKSLRVDKEMQ